MLNEIEVLLQISQNYARMLTFYDKRANVQRNLKNL